MLLSLPCLPHMHIRPRTQWLRLPIRLHMQLLQLHTYPRMLVRLRKQFVRLVPTDAHVGGDHPRPLRLSRTWGLPPHAPASCTC